MSNSYQPSFLGCVLMDAIGMASYLIPGLGEGLDLIWAIIAGITFYKWFGSSLWAFGAMLEEALPFTDIIPLFTIGYFQLKSEN